MRHFCTFITIISAGLFFSCQKQVKHEIPASLRLNEAYYSYALASLNETLEKDPDNAEAHFRKAEMLLQQEKASMALSSIRKAIEIDGEQPVYRLTSAKALLMKGQNREALREAREAARSGSPSVELYEILAEANLQSNFFAEALHYSDSALSLAPKNYRNSFRKGIALAALKDTVSAEKHLLESLELGAPPTEAYGELVSLYMSSGNFDKALTYMEKGLDMKHPDDQTLLLQARIYRHTGKQDSARAILYRVADSQNLDPVDVYQELKEWYFQNRTYDSAMHYANKMLGLQPLNKEPMLTLARVYDRRRSYQSALREYEKIVEMDSTQQEDVYKIAAEELDNLKRKVAYLWKKQQEEELMRLKRGIAPLPAIAPADE